MKRLLPWVLALLSLSAGGYAFVRYNNQHGALLARIKELETRTAQVELKRMQERAQTEALRQTDAAAQRVLAQQERRLHEIYPRIIPFSLSETNIILDRTFRMTVKPSLRHADISITISNDSPDRPWQPPRYQIGFLNADGFVSGHLDSGWFNTWVQPGTNLIHHYQVSFDFGDPVYCTMITSRQGSRN